MERIWPVFLLLVFIMSISCNRTDTLYNGPAFVDTLYISNNDTVFIVNNDTVFSVDTSARVLKDTLYKIDTVVTSSNDTLFDIDTIIQVRIDTIFSVDTVIIATKDTVVHLDTVTVAVDTLVLHDSTLVVTRVVSYDTQYLAVDTLTLVNQKALNLSGSTGEMNLSFLASLTQLEWLNLTGVQSESFAPLASCTNLRYLYLGGSSIKKLEDVRSLAKLLHLDFASNKLTDSLDLNVYPDLEFFRVNCDSLDYIAPISGLPKLITLYLGEGGRRCRLPVYLQNLPALKELSLPSGAEKVKLDSLTALDGTLSLGFSDISDITLNGLSAIDTLVISLPVFDRMTLTNMPELKHMELTFTEMIPSKETTVGGLSNLTSLILATKDLEQSEKWLPELTSLRSLKIGLFYTYNKIDSYSGYNKFGTSTKLPDISGLTDLRRLDLFGNIHIKDISGIDGLKSLACIDISFCDSITDLSPLHSCLEEGDTLIDCIGYSDEFYINEHLYWDFVLSKEDVLEFEEQGVIVLRPAMEVHWEGYGNSQLDRPIVETEGWTDWGERFKEAF